MLERLELNLFSKAWQISDRAMTFVRTYSAMNMNGDSNKELPPRLWMGPPSSLKANLIGGKLMTVTKVGVLSSIAMTEIWS